MNIHDFDDIRPYMAEELDDVFDKLLNDPEFRHIAGNIFSGVPISQIEDLVWGCSTNESFQQKLIYPFLKQLLSVHSKGLHADYSSLNHDMNYTFISNHRDIVLDPALLDVSLLENDFNTVEIAIGDNLLIRPWIKDLVRINKSFIVKRSLNMREMLLASAKLSKYMHFAINEKHEHLWIAQREGRAKDGNDQTQESVLKMMSMGGDLRELNIVPLSISYEYDPCDYLKASEMQQKRDIEGFKKSQQDDLDNMKTGIFGKKGRIHYKAGRCINDYLDSLPSDMPKTEYFKAVASYIDQEIYNNYEPYAIHYVALDKHLGEKRYSDRYSKSDEEKFEAYVEGQLKKVSIANADFAFLRSKIYEMYANPMLNREKVFF